MEQALTKSPRHSITLQNRSQAIFTGVTDVDNFNENEINLAIEEGYVTLTGEDLHIHRLDLAQGEVVVDGTIDGVLYARPRNTLKSGWKKLLG